MIFADRTTLPKRIARRAHRASGFTLIEVMISIALTLGLIIGVNQVFKVTADTVGTASALSAKIRDSRAAQSVLYNEINHMVTRDAPFLIIDSRRLYAYRTAADQAGDIDGLVATIDFDGDNAEGTTPVEQIRTTDINSRNHRADTLSFFARDLYRRQTGNSTGTTGIYVADMSTNEAWVTYQHMRVYDQQNNPDADISYPPPAYGDANVNPRNFFASDWVLGRVVMCMTMPEENSVPPDGYGDEIFDKPLAPRTSQYFWKRADLGGVTDLQQLQPLGFQTQASGGGPNIFITDARFDLVGTTIDQFRQILDAYIVEANAGTGGFDDEWWSKLAGQPTGAGSRFRVNPYPTRPLTPRKLAQTAPALLSNCSQFMVEFAGDFITQDSTPTAATYGDAIVGDLPAGSVDPDGVTDFFIEDPTGAKIRRTRWYGFPRDTNGDRIIKGWIANRKNNEMLDVLPLRDVMRTIPGVPNNHPGAPFEKQLGQPNNVDNLPARDDYAAAGAVANNGAYIAAWGPTDSIKPQMLRIVFTLDDPTGKLGDGQTYEYVINLP